MDFSTSDRVRHLCQDVMAFASTLGLAYDDDGLIVAQCFCSLSILKRGHFLHGVVTQDDESLSVES